eukprot:COSAG04_NODE_30280_length_263_cov_1.890244_1_plen_54_part_10
MEVLLTANMVLQDGSGGRDLPFAPVTRRYGGWFSGQRRTAAATTAGVGRLFQGR